MSAKQLVREATETIARGLLAQCTEHQQARFARVWSYPYPGRDAISAMNDMQLSDSINLMERTIAANSALGQPESASSAKP